ncbi:alpha/beta hydrolase family protein [Paenibacillus mucilaginosus]|uniref:Dienelactone hydrolase domain-containing protein n=1 Tax=Paenibacillus mucilaginosus (strain KNP414) TaxID=1036673 RepID=F8F9B2_PAEMK|nr:alpha/beta hydrolase [Paenibacillus mucilaginosus]AEI43040.1 hypothetical protein KNP414_04510 [Paenibacillus mucilaginosus KNP414]MCG7215979.1 alpha/beta hydrolase [Paenibacillus mucilaginosus]WDM24664.1 alpha/beta hydrolase [Paenibacillus mucilaginosus]
MTQVLTVQEFTVFSPEGTPIHGIIHALEDGVRKPVLILSHGFRGFKEWGFWPHVANGFAERGFYTVRFDFSRIAVKNSGAGERLLEESLTVSRELGDLESLLYAVLGGALPLAGEADSARIALLGHSRAGSSNLIFAGEHDNVSGVVVWNGGATPSAQVSGQPSPIAEDIEQHAERFHIPTRLGSLKIPVLAVQGASDAERVLESFRLLQEAAPEQTYVSIPGADHFFGIVHPYQGTTPYLEEAFEATAGFLTQHLLKKEA